MWNAAATVNLPACLEDKSSTRAAVETSSRCCQGSGIMLALVISRAGSLRNWSKVELPHPFIVRARASSRARRR